MVSCKKLILTASEVIVPDCFTLTPDPGQSSMMQLRKISLLILILTLILLSFVPVSAQNPFNTYGFDLNQGFLWAHRKEISALPKDRYQGFELRAGIRLFEKDWHHTYRFPEIGLSYSFHNPGNPEILGYGHAFTGYGRFRIFETRRTGLFYKLHFGLAYLTKKFNADSNYYNIAIGSHLNVFGRLGIDYRYRISQDFHLKLGMQLSHFSNTSYARPNLGINLLSASLGIEFTPQISPLPLPELRKVIFNPYWEFNLMTAFSAKEITPPGEKKYLTSSLSANIERRISAKHQLGIGYDFFFDASLAKQMTKLNHPTEGISDYFRNGFHISYGLRYNRVLFAFQVGRYIAEDFLPDSSIYNRLMLRIYGNKNLFFNISLKSHYGRADFSEFGIGYAFQK